MCFLAYICNFILLKMSEYFLVLSLKKLCISVLCSVLAFFKILTYGLCVAAIYN